jgi:hypothetical protein
VNLIPPQQLPKLGDASCCVLSDGQVLVGTCCSDSGETVIFDPTADWGKACFKGAAGKGTSSNEETWTLLQDGRVLSIECSNTPHAKRYVPAQDQWVDAGTLSSITDEQGKYIGLVQDSSKEIGPALLLPSGDVFAIGATGYTAIYENKSGKWNKGPPFPKALDIDDGTQKPLQAKDAPACLLPDGRVLCMAEPPKEGTGDESYPGPAQFFEYDGIRLTEIASPRLMVKEDGTFKSWMLILPTGEVLYSEQSRDLYIYRPDYDKANPTKEWQPRIIECPKALMGGKDYVLKGTLLNGISQACSYGDDASMATNYPIVRLQENTPNANPKMYYCKTYDHSTMAVARGLTVHSTSFYVYPNVPAGKYELFVIANGLASRGYSVDVSAT